MTTGTRSLSLEYVKTIGMTNNGFNGRGFANPYDLVVSRDSRIFVLNRCDPQRASAIRIGIMNLDEEDYLGEFGFGTGSGQGQLVLPVAMALDSEERVYVTDEYNQRVTVYTLDGELISCWGESGSGRGQFSGPAGIAISRDDNVYVVDQGNHRIQIYDSSGTFIDQWGGFGSEEGHFNLPWGITIDTHGLIYVADWRNDRIQKFASDGEFLSAFGTSGGGDGEFSRPSGVAVDDAGNMYISDWGNERVQVLDSEGNFRLTLRGEATLSKWANEFFASNPDELETRNISNLIPELPDHLNTPYHVSSQTEPYFWGPVAISLDADDHLYVVEANRHRFQVYRKV